MSSYEAASSCLRVSGASDRMASFRRLCASFRSSEGEGERSSRLPAIVSLLQSVRGSLTPPAASKAFEGWHHGKRAGIGFIPARGANDYVASAAEREGGGPLRGAQ